jgi:hypothetical protein
MCQQVGVHHVQCHARVLWQQIERPTGTPMRVRLLPVMPPVVLGDAENLVAL